MNSNDMNTWLIEAQEPVRHHRGRRGPHGGFGPGGEPGFGPFGPGPRGRGRGGRGGRARGDVRAAVLVLLAEEPRHGYDLIRAIEERTSGAWAPSPGSIYPTLQSLEDEGLISIAEVDGRKTASLTDAGREWVGQNVPDPESLFAGVRGDDAMGHVRMEMRQLGEAAVHVARQMRTEEDAARVAEILATARKDLYRLLTEKD